MREQLLARLLDSSVQEEWAREKAREMRLSIAGEKWTIALIRYNGGEVASRERELLPHMVRQRAEKELPRYCPVICFLYQDYVAVLATLDQQQDMLQLINGMRQICLSAQRFLQLELAVGIGSTCTALSQLRRSAMEARNALDYQTMVGEEPVVYIGDIEPQTTEASALEGYSFRELLAAMRLEDNDQIEETVRNFLSVLRAKKMPVSQYRLSVMELATELLRVIKTYELEDTDDLSQQLVELTLLKNLNSPWVFESRLIQLCQQISRSIAQISLPHVQNLFDDPDCRYRWVVSLSRAVELTENGQVGQGVLLLDINFSGIEQIFNNAGYGDSGYAYLVGEDGEMIYHPRQQLVYSDLFEEDSLAYVGEEDGNYIGKVSGQDSVITVKTVGYTGWKIVRVAPVGIYSDDVLFIQLAGLIGVVCLAILIILVNQSVSSQIARPVEQLQKSVEKLENGDLDAEIAIGGSYEIQRLGRTVQSMAQEMKNLMADVVKEQESKHKSELDALQHQINPHFLYNTLSSIVWMIEKGRAEESVNMIGALSRLFRISLSKGRTIIRVGDELEHAKSYLTIQKVRYKNKFTVTFDTDPEVLELSTVTALGWNTSIRNGRRSRTKGQCSPWRYWRCTTWASPMRRKTCPFYPR